MYEQIEREREERGPEGERKKENQMTGQKKAYDQY